MAKREFLMLAHNYEDDKYGIGNWFVSEKLDGMRAFWDGGVTRGKYTDEVPFANVEKDGRYIIRPKATGLWSRYGKSIQAPGWWLDKLPNVPLDGELYAGRGGFQLLMSTVKDLVAGAGWQQVRYMAFDSPSLATVLGDGRINVPNFRKTFRGICQALEIQTLEPRPFEATLTRLSKLEQNEVWCLHEQEQLTHHTSAAVARVSELLFEVTKAGGEGLILRAPHSVWTPERVRTMLKVKKMHDMEGTVIGYTWGRRTELGSKLLGLMGALVLRLDSGVRLELSGFTDEERRIEVVPDSGQILLETVDALARIEGEEHPGESVRDGFHNPSFKIGQRVTFKYRELTDGGIPKEARYWRKHESTIDRTAALTLRS